MAINLASIFDDNKISNQEKGFLQNLQANILKGHGRGHVALVLLTIKDVAKARTFIKHYPVSDAYTQMEETNAYKKDGTPGGFIRLFYISQSGLVKFGKGDHFKQLSPFAKGMAADTSVLDSGDTTSWQSALKKQSDIMLLIAHHDEVKLARSVCNLVKEFDEDGSPFDINLIQEGRAYKNADGEGIEHFGYIDGRSQPLMLKSEIDNEKESRRGGIDQYDPTAKLEQFLLPDPLTTIDGFGSFFVFRKLEQDVAGFKQREDKLAEETLGLTGDDKERAGAMVVGRFEDGTPLTLHNEEDGVPVVNNFNYNQDADGAKCPFHAHIRKSNPRGSSPRGLEEDKLVQMARRGITYGARLQDPVSKEFIDKPNDGVGLLFMSYQASIKDQFQFMQSSWVNNENFPKSGVGIDPVIGQKKASNLNPTPQNWFPQYGQATNAKADLFEGFVKLKGGEYFYTPSLTGIKNL